MESISDWNAIVRLLFSLSLRMLISPSIKTLSESITTVDGKSDNSDSNSVWPGGL